MDENVWIKSILFNREAAERLFSSEELALLNTFANNHTEECKISIDEIEQEWDHIWETVEPEKKFKVEKVVLADEIISFVFVGDVEIDYDFELALCAMG